MIIEVDANETNFGFVVKRNYFWISCSHEQFLKLGAGSILGANNSSICRLMTNGVHCSPHLPSEIFATLLSHL